MKDLYLISECFVDTNLVETLLDIYQHSTNGVNHQYGCNNVAKTMRLNYTDGFSVGVMDADKKRPSYLESFNKIGQSEHLTLLKHETKHHYIILVGKAMEDFILSCARETGIDLSQYGIAPDLESLKSVTKNMQSKSDSKLKNLFKDIKEAGEMRLFGEILCYMKTNKYNCDIEKLKALFIRQSC